MKSQTQSSKGSCGHWALTYTMPQGSMQGNTGSVVLSVLPGQRLQGYSVTSIVTKDHCVEIQAYRKRTLGVLPTSQDLLES